MLEVERIVRAVERRCRSRDALLLLLAFDGVLVDYGDPEAVRLSRRLRKVLRSLAGHPRVFVGIVSGRRLADLRDRVNLLAAEVFYVGLHGLEIEGPGFTTGERSLSDNCTPGLRAIVATAGPSLSGFAGVHIEDKEGAIALHTREAAPGDAVWARLHLLSVAADLVRRDELRVIRGSHVLELLPNVGHTRTLAITEIRRRLERHHQTQVLTVYVGEDVPDDDAVEAIGAEDIVAVVGRRARRARFHLESTAAVERLLWGVATVMTPPRAVKRPS